jgi:hypothetical protein
MIHGAAAAIEAAAPIPSAPGNGLSISGQASLCAEAMHIVTTSILAGASIAATAWNLVFPGIHWRAPFSTPTTTNRTTVRPNKEGAKVKLVHNLWTNLLLDHRKLAGRCQGHASCLKSFTGNGR